MKKIISLLTIFVMVLAFFIPNITNVYAAEAEYEVDLTNLKVKSNGTESTIKNYTQDDFEQFVADYNSGNLPAIYTTEFLYDGVGMVKTPDLDDFVEANSNDTKIKYLSIKAINVNTTGNIKFSGEIKGGMIAVNTNNVSGEINLILNGVNIDTDSKKAPAIYVYNKDINYTNCKVTIKTVSGTKNYIEGGKFKKVSLVGSEELSSYESYYSGTAKTNYNTYTNYYGIYTKEQINNILFAKVKADSEDLADGDPYYFYKGAGAISSDIDLYFEGEGYLSVISKNKEGIETKGNLTLTGGTGDYYVAAQDDCLNTTTSAQEINNARNNLTINVKSLVAIVDEEADEGDCIDSNGTLTIDGGTIIAIAHPTSQDDGLDSESGTYINGGTVVATGNMSDRIEDSSKQDFIKLNFSSKQDVDTLICITDTNNNPVIAFKSNRTFTTLTISSPDLTEQTYYVYKGGTISGTENNGLYTKIDSYDLGTKQQWTSGGNQFGGQRLNGGEMPNGEMPEGMEPPEGMELPDGAEPPEGMELPDRTQMPDGVQPPDMKQMPNGTQMSDSTQNSDGNQISNNDRRNRQRPGEDGNSAMTPPDGNFQNGGTPPEKPDGDNRQMNNQNGNSGESSAEFTLTSQNHTFNNVADYDENSDTLKGKYGDTTFTGPLPIVVICIASGVLIISLISVIVIIKKKSNK